MHQDEQWSVGPPVSLRIGHTGLGIGIGIGIGLGWGAPVQLRNLPVVGPGLSTGLSQASGALSVRSAPFLDSNVVHLMPSDKSIRPNLLIIMNNYFRSSNS